MTDVWMTTLVSVGSAAFIGWVLYRVARVASPATPVEIGRTWLAYFHIPGRVRVEDLGAAWRAAPRRVRSRGLKR